MWNRQLHIIAFDIPYPVDHGGFFDLFYKLEVLHRQEITIYLHCFEYGRQQQQELLKFCKEVFYYKRQTGYKGLSASLPYIVASRKNPELIQNLSKDNYPILLEGTHCTFLLYKNYFSNRNVLYRLHNIESIYYSHLFRNETNVFKKTYYFIESKLLKAYERKVLPKASVVLTVSENDLQLIKEQMPTANLVYLPVFMPERKVDILTGVGSYCLYHGNLSVSENEQVAIWLIDNVFQNSKTGFVIAGKKPSKTLLETVKGHENIKILADPSDGEMQELIQQAHINIILSFNETGIKLKLVNALFQGRHCLVNTAAVKNTGLADLCHIANSPAEIIATISQLQKQPLMEHKAAARKQKLEAIFNNEANAQKLIALLYSHYQ